MPRPKKQGKIQTLAAVLALPRALRRSPDLPEVPCVYFALNRARRILYIGSTRSLRRRWISHSAANYAQYVAWLRIEGRVERFRVERECIRRFQPPLNSPRDKHEKLVMAQGAVPLAVRDAVREIAQTSKRTLSQTVRRLLDESPRVKAATKNGSKKMSLIRLPLKITKQELPPKLEPRGKVVGEALFVAALILLWVYVLGPAMEIWMNG